MEEVRSGIEKYGESFRSGQKGIIDSPVAVGGWPELRQLRSPADQDNDGIADEWELRVGLDPGNPADNVLHTLSGEYTNLEMYIHSLTIPVQDKPAN